MKILTKLTVMLLITCGWPFLAIGFLAAILWANIWTGYYWGDKLFARAIAYLRIPLREGTEL